MMSFLFFIIFNSVIFDNKLVYSQDSQNLLENIKEIHNKYTILKGESEINRKKHIHFIELLSSLIKQGTHIKINEFKDFIINYEQIQSLAKEYKKLVEVDVKNFRGELDRLLRSGELTEKDINELRELFDDRNLIDVISLNQLNEQEKKEFIENPNLKEEI